MSTAVVHSTNPDEIALTYEDLGDPADPPLLLVMGFTAQMTSWDDGFCDALVAAGRRVIRFDNRDCGLSTKLDGIHADPMAVVAALRAGGEAPSVPYTLSDMGNDAIGLLDHLGVERAHLVGASMGGMIVQTMAIDHPERVASMVSIMSMPGGPSVGQPTPEALTALLTPPPADREAFIAAATRAEVWASKRYVDHEAMRARAAREFDRSFYPEGASRQLAAIYASGDRSAKLEQLDVPCLVIHGRDDTLIQPDGGERTAELVPGAELLMVDDMGHDLPPPLWPALVEAIVTFQARA